MGRNGDGGAERAGQEAIAQVSGSGARSARGRRGRRHPVRAKNHIRVNYHRRLAKKVVASDGASGGRRRAAEEK